VVHAKGRSKKMRPARSTLRDRINKIIFAIQKDNELLRNASVLVSLFRVLYLARPGERRDSMARQLTTLLRDFATFDAGTVLLGSDEDQLAAQFDNSAVYRRLSAEGPIYTEDLTAVPPDALWRLAARGSAARTGRRPQRACQPGIGGARKRA